VSTLPVAGIQHDICWEDRAATLARLTTPVRDAAAGGARLIVLTEMFAVGFTLDTGRVAEPPDGPTTAWLQEQARTHDVWICGSIPVLDPDHDRPANRLVLAGPHGTTVTYDKIHPFSYAGEHRRYLPGTAPVGVEIDGVRVHLSVCYDLRFADLYWSAAPDTDLYVVVANWPAPRRDHWRALLVARAIENQAYVIGVNRIGTGGRETYVGDSVIVDPWGRIEADAEAAERTITATVDTEVVRRTRETYPFLADRVPVRFPS